ncbi:putative bifunctional diguanylate cyclase/phosphodiesterase [Streptomyces europaeiscabiei]|uniref:putative bifunctional diguanylate cyclase/phosphodiesterase n=1 Tax=Streptomyces europaeiscabiei TaxID=146819 RepID=UPI0029B4BBEB|nr:EAL domain-containing protein [Streptomyces europaeiscabiei]MDX2528152.1 EAL domain-containing protein [Streptomyces europaeiscabiei]MDX3834871.1 EAL domain-containing protein [Streptomyces europaeiscabiei]MDX3843730.1 EAL domain-containing protein [Streptomyces europaeiscabiei]MDX3863209.1 EAL domain-containing protein [Streptomyces europaeiscabiei]MDX3873191.1 EAL domain-containing protein [Streptomyces europaeiscabiei]
MRAEPDGPEDRLRRFATIWSRAVFPATSTSLTRPEFEEQLLPLARRLSEALRARTYDAEAGKAVGAALVEAHCTEPEALGQTLDCVDAYLVLYCGGDGPQEDLRARAARLQSAMAAGFAEALRQRTLAEQEAIARAALEAQGAVALALHATEARFRAVFEGAAIGIGIADLEGNILQVNGALQRMFGVTEQTMRGRRVPEWKHPEDAPQVWRLYEELVRGDREHYHTEKAFHRPDGTVLWTNLTVSLLRDADGRPQYQLALMEDTTERRLLNLRLRYEATHDALTGLPNRTLFFERLEKALAAGDGQRFGLCYLDLDGFKTINDSLGHAAGDRLLVEVADRLQSCATAPGEMVARLGGDEFVALTTGTDTEREVDELADRIMNALVTPVRIEGRELLVRGSIGIVEGPAGERGPAEVLRSADITMYRAKSAGGNRYEMADAEADARAITRHGLTTALPAALDRGEFFIEYQPLVHLGDGTVRGAEALVRWLHPQHGVLGPDRFIPLAERTGLIVPLGRWVLEQSVRQARAWQERHGGTGAGGPLRVNVNLSPCQLTHPGLVQDTVDILERAGLPPDALCLEVTESALIGADDDLLKPLRRLSEMGVDIALDDFGTGYSNLANLRRLPVRVLKLDRSFTQSMQQFPADPVDLKIVEGIVSLAHSLDLAVTVEGVETGAQAEQLRILGCDTAQGWYYARPGPPERLHELALVDATG